MRSGTAMVVKPELFRDKHIVSTVKLAHTLLEKQKLLDSVEFS